MSVRDWQAISRASLNNCLSRAFSRTRNQVRIETYFGLFEDWYGTPDTVSRFSMPDDTLLLDDRIADGGRTMHQLTPQRSCSLVADIQSDAVSERGIKR